MNHTSFSSPLRLAAVSVSAVSVLALPATAQTNLRPLKPVTIALGTQVVNVTYPWLTLPIALGYWKEEG